MEPTCYIYGIPEDIPDTTRTIFRSRLLNATNKLLQEIAINNLHVILTNTPFLQDSHTHPSNNKNKALPEIYSNDQELSIEERSQKYKAIPPLFSFDQLIVSDEVMDELLLTISLVEVENTGSIPIPSGTTSPRTNILYRSI